MLSRCALFIVVGLLLSGLWGPERVLGQEKSKPAATQPPATPAAAAPQSDVPPADSPDAQRTRKPPRGRLPAYYGRVVSEEQRLEIYRIQAMYNKQIDDLRSQIEGLLTQRDAEVSDVLTEEQLREVEQLAEAARSRRSTRSGSGPPASEPEQ